jgi:S1-C subfamily serine protease
MMTVGTSVELALNREGKKMTVKVSIGKTPKEQESASLDVSQDHPALEGASFEDSPDKSKGVRVTEVQRNSNAFQFGLRPRDIIVAVNRTPVKDMADLNSALKDSPRSTVLSVRRGDEDLRLVMP